jgi:hypothetical protein
VYRNEDILLSEEVIRKKDCALTRPYVHSLKCKAVVFRLSFLKISS